MQNAVLVAALFAVWEDLSVIDRPPTEPGNRHYVVNRAPLAPVPLVKLPVDCIRPRGWLRRQLVLMAEGFVGRLGEISPWLRREGNAWLSPTGEGHSNWEELPYWLKGFGDLAYLLRDEKLIAEARVWIDGAIASQRADGYFGPRANLEVIQTDRGRKPDLWPNMVMLNALQSYYEWTAGEGTRNRETGNGTRERGTGDERVIHLMQRYFRWELEFPDADFLLPFWQQQRAADNLASVHWLYNRTGEAWLLDLAAKIQRHTADWTAGVANWHGVNISQSFRGPAVYWPQSRDPRHLQAPYRNYDTVMREYGQVPGGMFGADENCRKGMRDPRQAAESCTMVEFMYSFEQLTAITGDPLWADRCEEVAFNSLPVAATADWKALRYLSSPNMISSDARSKAPGYENAGPMQLYDPRDHRCCQHNVAHGWPYFTEHLWMATADDGLAAVLYAPCEVTARVGDGGAAVTVSTDTHYPFERSVQLTLSMDGRVRFPLYLRVPRWATRAGVVVNAGEESAHAGANGRFLRIEREWRPGDRVRLEFEWNLRLTRWPANHDSVSLSWGPLALSLDLREEARLARDGDAWPAWELVPRAAWNYGLDAAALDSLADSYRVQAREWPGDDQPFTREAAPVEVHGPARRIADWQADHHGLVGTLQPSPARTDQPVETVRLIPMGCARLRIAQFPTASDAANAHAWSPPQRPQQAIPASASQCWREDTLDALSDGLSPASSGDFNVPRFTWWDHRGTAEWVQYDFPAARRVSKVAVYWFDDSGRGRCRPPASWRLLYKPIGAGGGEEWRPVAPRSSAPGGRSAEPVFGVEIDRFNAVEFEPVETTALRIEVQLRPEFSGGMLEWRVE